MTYQALNQEQPSTVIGATRPNSFKFNTARMHDIYRLPKNTELALDTRELGETLNRSGNNYRSFVSQELK